MTEAKTKPGAAETFKPNADAGATIKPREGEGVKPSSSGGGVVVFLRAIVAVLAGFIGIRGGAAAKGDSSLRPMHLIVAGLLAVGGFVFLLLAIVHKVAGL